jgi:hypothetical protein
VSRSGPLVGSTEVMGRSCARTGCGAAGRRLAGAALALGLVGCIDPKLVLGTGEDGSPVTTSGVVADTSAGEGTTEDDPFIPSCDPDNGCKNKIDLLFVIDNSGTMGEEQLNLARNFPLLIEQLESLTDAAGRPVGADVNVMVTTTDVGANPYCHGVWEKPDYVAARGSPIHSACTERLGRFTGLGSDPLVIEHACTEVCDPNAPIAPTDQFLHFDAQGDNVPDGDPAEALACIGPQGIDGCGYEAPLEAMAQALNPMSCWNDPDNCTDPEWAWIERPFLRDDAVLAIAIITDEADCSIRDYTIMENELFMEVNPQWDFPTKSSAVCWHAGVQCSDLDEATGVYSGCESTNKDVDANVGVSDADAVLHPVSRYVGLLRAFQNQGKEVIMLGVLGVPLVTDHAATPPHQPTAGGVQALVFRDWRDPQYPDGDILPDEYADGVRAAVKQYEFGIGPGCTGSADGGMTFTGQAIPPVRIRSVCESLDDETRIRCCIESICDSDFSPALRCLTGLIQDAVTPVG